MGPAWLGTEQYDILATLPPGTNAEQLRSMLQALLKERFGISLHRETRTLPVYLLTVAKNGPKLHPAEKLPTFKDDAEKSEALHAGTSAMMQANIAKAHAGNLRSSTWFNLSSATTATFAAALSSYVDRPVKDGTHLEGLYAFKLEWVPDRASPAVPNGSADDTPSGPSLSTALQEQLGLKLQAEKSEIEVLVIDTANKSPTEN